jgi:BolA protein
MRIATRPDKRDRVAAWTMGTLMTVAETIRRKLTEGLAPSRLEVVDDSSRHAGHAGAQPGGETHFNVVVISERFAGMSRVDRQRLVYGLLQAELAGPVHALALVTRTKAEQAALGGG